MRAVCNGGTLQFQEIQEKVPGAPCVRAAGAGCWVVRRARLAAAPCWLGLGSLLSSSAYGGRPHFALLPSYIKEAPDRPPSHHRTINPDPQIAPGPPILACPGYRSSPSARSRLLLQRAGDRRGGPAARMEAVRELQLPKTADGGAEADAADRGAPAQAAFEDVLGLVLRPRAACWPMRPATLSYLWLFAARCG